MVSLSLVLQNIIKSKHYTNGDAVSIQFFTLFNHKTLLPNTLNQFTNQFYLKQSLYPMSVVANYLF